MTLIDPLSVIAAVRNRLPQDLHDQVELSVHDGIREDFATIWCRHNGKAYTCVITESGFQHLDDSARDIANFIKRSFVTP